MSFDINTNPYGLNTFVVDDVGDSSIERTKCLLAGINHGAQKAIGSAIKRAASSGVAYAAKAARKEYIISAADFKKYTKTKRHYVTDKNGTTVEITFMGYHIPLAKFDTRVSKDGLVTTRVKRTSARIALDNVFQQTVGKYGNIGVFERVSGDRYPIAEKFGPSVPQMIESNDDLAQDIGDNIREEFDKRIEHEVIAILNGWRSTKK